MYMDQVHASSCEEQALLGYLRTVNDEKGRDKTKCLPLNKTWHLHIEIYSRL